jgi:flagellar protein FliS
MTAYGQVNKLAAYSSVATHGGIAAGDPHLLILMLMDGALERLATARGCLQRGEIATKSQLIQRIVSIVGELRASLDMQQGGALAESLNELYGYMERQLVRANIENRQQYLDEVGNLLGEIRGAWAAMPPGVTAQRTPPR